MEKRPFYIVFILYKGFCLYMKDSLIKLLGLFPVWHKSLKDVWFPEAVERLANYILADGWIRPPCKVGAIVYFPTETNFECELDVDVGTVFSIGIDERHIMWISVRYQSGLIYYHTSHDFGKTVFFTREEAEKITF